jgi:iron complex outermembrane receptor protein
MPSNRTDRAFRVPRRYCLSLAIAISGALACSGVHAVDPAAPSAATAPAADDTNAPKQLGEITVTAEKRTENIQKVPVSIATIDQETLDNMKSAGDDVQFLSARVPSLMVESSFGRTFPRFYIRGLGNTDFDLNTSQPVSLVYDDVVLENPILKGFPVFDIAQTEVLRGPQGTLFGRNTPAGVVKFDSNKPSQDTEGYFDVNYGNLGTANFEGAIGGALSQDWTGRFSILEQHRDNWVTNEDPNDPQHKLGGYNEFAARLQLEYKPSDSFDALFNLHAMNLDGSAILFRGNLIQPGTNDIVAGFDPSKISLDGLNYQHVDSHGFSAKLTWDFNSMELVSITSYDRVSTISRGDIDGLGTSSYVPLNGANGPYTPYYSETADDLPFHRQITEEVHLGSKDTDVFDWMVGAFYFNENIKINDFNYDCPDSILFVGECSYTVQPSLVAIDGMVQQKQLNVSDALFANAGYQVTDSLKIKGGVRYSRDNKYYEVTRIIGPYGSGPLAPQFIDTDYGHTSWDLSAVYSLNNSTDVYGRVATSFRAPSIQGRLLFQPNPTVAKAETITSYETGIKTKFWDNRATLNFDLYDFVMHNQQLTVTGGAANDTELVNARKTIGRGAELEAQAYLTDHLMVMLGGSYNFTKIEDAGLRVQPCTNNGVVFCTLLDPTFSVPVVPGCMSNCAMETVASVNGNPLPQSPKWIGNFTARYAIPYKDGELYALTDWSYRSKINFFLYDAVEYTGKSWLQGGLRIGYDWDGGKRDISLFCRNCTNQIRVLGGIDFDNLTGYINQPRTWGAQFRASL